MLVAPETIAAIAQKSGLTPKEVYREFEAWGLRIRGGLLGRDKKSLDTNLVGVNGFITRSNKVADWHPDDERSESIQFRGYALSIRACGCMWP